MMGILSDKLFETNSRGAAICLNNANCFVQRLATPSETDSRFTNEIVTSLKNPLIRISNTEKMWTDFHKLRSSEEYCRKWQD